MIGAIDEIFAEDGPLAHTIGGFESRPGQVQMARLIERGFLENAHTIVEAGTGVGKSFAYLVPALRSRKKVVISTGTIALQEQLVNKDIPRVVEALGLPARVVLLKGRNHYLCRAKYGQMRSERLVAPSLALERLWEWAERTTTGDRGELDFIPSSEDWESLDADADDCVGEFCDRFSDCWFFARRDAARYADVVVVNHALFFLDLALGGGLLPPYDYVILDEAHQCERYATAALTLTLSHALLNRMLRKLHGSYHLPAHHDAEIAEGIRRLTSVLARTPGERFPLRPDDDLEATLDALHDALSHLENWVHLNWDSAMRRPAANAAERERRRDLALRAITAQLLTIERIRRSLHQSDVEAETIAWVERAEAEPRYEINAAPFEVAEFLRAQLFARTQSVVLTSATIAEGTSFAFLRSSLGIDEAQELVAPSPFDYPRQARLFVAPSRLNPKSDEFARMAAPLVEECLERSRGRAFVLFTSYARLRELYALLRDRLPYPVRMQGDLPRSQLVEWFRTTRNAVLFATATFWEGIDVVGEALSCVIVDRLPCPSPGDPLVAARVAAIEARGGNGFSEYMTPVATMRLKQGFGRLIRSKSDKGLLALLDG
ncbi:MAG: ATP-dependent DNA helicase, partial [Candidatus Eremiobacteraeota bacterium]|nr:ATP-dependent DNA helicase [Candidatus Eremiobacteraeota bacterium]